MFNVLPLEFTFVNFVIVSETGLYYYGEQIPSGNWLPVFPLLLSIF